MAEEQGTLHIYPQESPHEPAILVGDEAGLLALASAISDLLAPGMHDSNNATSTAETFTHDGEGYSVHICRTESDRMAQLLLPYRTEWARGEGEEPAFWPEIIAEMKRAAADRARAKTVPVLPRCCLVCSACGPIAHVLDGDLWRCELCGGITIAEIPGCPGLVRRVREASGLTMGDLSRLLGVTLVQVSDMERGVVHDYALERRALTAVGQATRVLPAALTAFQLRETHHG